MELQYKHKWVLEGDLEAVVILDLTFDAVVTPQGIQKLREMKPVLSSVTFGIAAQTLTCDGLKKSTELPIGVRMWFETQFTLLWCRSVNLQNRIQSKMDERARQQYFEELAT